MRLRHIDLQVSDVDAAREFFETYFGLHCTYQREKQIISRRSFNCTALASAIAALAPALPGSEDKSQQGSVLKESTRREVIKERLPGEPQRQLTLVEVVYAPGAGSPPHLHANGVMAFVVVGSIVSKVGDEPKRTFHAGEAWWEPPDAVHRVSRNASSSEPARLLAIYIAPSEARDKDLMQPI